MANEHDSRYKKLFSNHKVVQELLENFVDIEIVKDLDFRTLERLDKSFITDEFANRESDIIYKINCKGSEVYIFLLIEFQSKVDRFISIRMLRYIVEFYQYLIENKSFKELPPVLPVMLYNGDDDWNAPENIKELIKPLIPKRFIPDFSYYKIVEKDIDEGILFQINNLLTAIFYIERIDPKELKEKIEVIVEMIKDENPEEFKLFINWINNYFNYEEKETINEIKSIKEVKTMFATALERWQEEIKIEGKIEGKIESKFETAKAMKAEGLDLRLIAKVTGLSIKEIEKL